MSELKSYISSDEKISIRQQCELLNVNRSTYYYKTAVESDEKLSIIRWMDG